MRYLVTININNFHVTVDHVCTESPTALVTEQIAQHTSLKMLKRLTKIFKREERVHWSRRDMSSSEDKSTSTELMRGSGRRLPFCINTQDGNEVMVVIENKRRSPATEISEQREVASKSPNEIPHLTQNGLENKKERKKLTLKQLQEKRPPGYKQFEASLGLQELDDELALKLWEDFFKPLSSFEMLGIGSE